MKSMRLVKLIGSIPAKLLGMPVLLKVTAVAVGLITLLGVVMGWQIGHAYLHLEAQELEQQATFIARVLAVATTPLLREGDSAKVQEVLDGIKGLSPTTGTIVEQIEVTGTNDAVLAHASYGAVPGGDKRAFRDSAPLNGSVPGRISVTLSDGHIAYEIRWHNRRIIAATVLVSGLALLLAWCLMRLVTRPIFEMVKVTRAVKGGALQARVTVRAKDEVGELTASFNEMLAALQEKEALNQQLRRKLLAADEVQRRNISRGLEEDAAQVLAALAMGLAAQEKGNDRSHLAEMRGAASQTLNDLRDLSLELSPSALQDLGLIPALRILCRRLAERSGVEVLCSAIALDDLQRLEPELETAIYQIVREAVKNALQHGRPHSVEVTLQRKADTILAFVEDDGAGFDATDWRKQSMASDRSGLLGIEERAILLGGELRVSSRPGGGTQLVVVIPLRPQVSDAGPETSRAT